ncbi:MAG: hypothetical protein CNE98_07025 [Bacteroidetes bacterium MED-G17]|nr:MAG: hypothetical protein CBB99_02990 [Bacteroidetes bacterium TMED39]PDH51340.1 MAG: hypothetical protein CNE98_07025 [Bacteroidetes bacterium MED-G17]
MSVRRIVDIWVYVTKTCFSIFKPQVKLCVTILGDMRQRSLFKKAFFRTSRALGPIEFLPKYDLNHIDIAKKW